MEGNQLGENEEGTQLDITLSHLMLRSESREAFLQLYAGKAMGKFYLRKQISFTVQVRI